MKKIWFLIIISLMWVLMANRLQGSQIHEGTSYEILDVEDKAKEMIKANFSNKFLLEENNDLFYIHFTLLNYENITNLVFELDNNLVGNISYIRENQADKTYVLTIKKDNINKKITVLGYVIPMQSNIKFSIKFNVNNLALVAKNISIKEYAPEFVPEIIFSENKNDYICNINADFIIPKAIAKLGDTPIDLDINVYDNDNNNLSIDDNKVKFMKSGLHFVKYLAQTSLYKTSLGNNSKNIKTITVNVLTKDGFYKLSDLKTKIEVCSKDSSFNNLKLAIEDITTLKKEIVLKSFSKNKKFYFYNLNLIKDSKKLDAFDNLEINFPQKNNFRQDNTNIYYYDGSKFEKVNYKYNDNFLKINTNKLGYYLIIDETKKSSAYMLILYISLSIILLTGLSIGAVFIYKKKRKTELI